MMRKTFVFQVMDSNAIVIADVDADVDDLEVQLTVTHGVLNIDPATGVTITGGANDSPTVTFTGTLAELNDALDGLVYTPDTLYLGADTLKAMDAPHQQQCGCAGICICLSFC